MPQNWHSTGIPEDLYQLIEGFIDECGCGYTSVGEFVREATRRLYMEWKVINKNDSD